MYVCKSSCKYVHVSSGICRGQSRQIPLELQVVVNCLSWVLGNKLGSSKRLHVLLTTDPFLKIPKYIYFLINSISSVPKSDVDMFIQNLLALLP